MSEVPDVEVHFVLDTTAFFAAWDQLELFLEEHEDFMSTRAADRETARRPLALRGYATVEVRDDLL